eukprot:Skav220717  [mRNA]  locus=scaffold1850:102915:105042:- [translate_table: standard]
MSQHGVVKFYNSLNGYGFIRRRSKGADVYVHRSAIADGKMLLRGDQVMEEEGRLCALRVTGGSGGFGLTFGCKVDRSTVKNLCCPHRISGSHRWRLRQGWGFIIQDAGGPNLFFHSNAIESGEASPPAVGSRVRYESVFDETRGSRKAQCVAVADETAPVAPVAPAPDVLEASPSDSEDEWELVT